MDRLEKRMITIRESCRTGHYYLLNGTEFVRNRACADTVKIEGRKVDPRNKGEMNGVGGA